MGEQLIFRFINGKVRPIRVTNKYMNTLIRNDYKTKLDKSLKQNKTQDTKQSDKKTYQLTNDQLQNVIDESISQWEDNYAKLYMTKMSPNDFLSLTANEQVMNMLEQTATKLDLNEMNKPRNVASMMYLDVDLEMGEVRGHEGRHRAYALKNAGYNEMDVIIWPWQSESDKYHSKERDNYTMTGQTGMNLNNNKVTVRKIVPVSKANIERIKRRDY